MGDQAIKLVDQINAVKMGNSGSAEALFRKHHERVFLAAYRVSGSVHDAEDVLQAVFLRLLSRQKNDQTAKDPASYLCRSAINASLDIIRSRGRQPLTNLEENENKPDPHAAPTDIDVSSAELRRHLRLALASLSPRSAEIFALRYFEEFGNAEIAEMLDTSSSSIAVTLHRTRDHLQELLREFEGENT